MLLFRKFISLFLFFFIISSCFAENVTTLSGKIQDLDRGSTIYLSQSSRGEILDSVLVKNDSFRFNLNISQGDAYFIQFRVKSKTFAQLVYMKDGSDIFLSIGENFNHISLSGSPMADDQDDFIKGLLPISQKQKLLEGKLVSNPDSLIVKEVMRQNLKAEENKYYLNWVNAHLNSPFSLVVICFYMEQTSVEVLEKLYDSLTDEAKRNNLVTQKIPIYFAERKENETFKIGNHLKNFILEDTLRKPHSISDLNKKDYLLLDIWATWCSPCRKSIPVLKELWDTYGHKNFKIISISADTDYKLWKQTIKKENMNWYHLSDLKGTDLGFIKDNNIYAYPTYILISPEGIIISKPYSIQGVKQELHQIFGEK